jgi:5-methylcytosine-specific restriction protein B
MSYFNQLSQFLEQAKTDNLKTKHFNSEYLGTKVKVSFGQGNSAKIPWISFLKKPNTTSNGIYPVYLFFKEFNLLILAYGISETNKPKSNWNISNKKTIKKYFEETYNQKPDRYGSSFIFKTYDLNKNLQEDMVDKDLKEILNAYKSIQFYKNKFTKLDTINQIQFNIKNFQVACKNAGLVYTDKLITRFVSSLLTKPFVILTGLSGSGKTKLAQAYVQWICQEESQYRIIPVGADWTNREPLLGYPNALKPEEYVKPDSGVIDLIIQANSNPELPHFLILDEMNLSHVERYFADFLSVMESNEEIPLYAEGTVDNGVPSKLRVPANLFIIGTVNIDETTNMFSPKVLDRANTIEFRIDTNEMEGFLKNTSVLNMKALLEEDEKTGKGANMSQNFIGLSNNKSFTTKDRDEINKTLLKFFGELQKTGAEFGYRSATEILRLINQLDTLNNKITTSEKIDIAIMQKLLPKLHGSRRKLSPILETLGSFCLTEDLKVVKDVFDKDDFDYSNDKVLYPLSLEKIARMYKGAIDNGFASYAEA